ncbi:MAG: hypothetical protein ACJ8F7_10505 [Gemmataceae bacterium]
MIFLESETPQTVGVVARILPRNSESGVSPMPFANPDRSRGYQREYRRLRRSGDGCTTPCTTPVPVEFRLKTAADVLALLEEQVNAVRADVDAGTLEKARTVGFLGSIALRAIEAGNLAARIEMLEAVLKQRKDVAK